MLRFGCLQIYASAQPYHWPLSNAAQVPVLMECILSETECSTMHIHIVHSADDALSALETCLVALRPYRRLSHRCSRNP